MLINNTLLAIESTLGSMDLSKMRRPDGWDCFGFTAATWSDLANSIEPAGNIAVFYNNTDSDVRLISNVTDLYQVALDNQYYGNMIYLTEGCAIYYETIEGIGFFARSSTFEDRNTKLKNLDISNASKYFQAELSSLDKLRNIDEIYVQSMRRMTTV